MNTIAALRHRNFRLMWVSLLVSNAGTWLQAVALDALLYDMTGRALDLGLINVIRAVTLISLAFLGGTVADRLDKRRLLMATQSLSALLAFALGALAHWGLLDVWHVMVSAFLGSVLLALDQPARQSLVPHLVPREYLMNAIALNSVTYTGAAAIGPALAGPVVRAFGLPWGFYLNGLSFFAVIWAVYMVRLAPSPRRQTPEKVSEAIASGLRYIAATPALLVLVSLLTMFAFFAIPYQSLLPVFAVKAFGGGVQELGWLRAAPGVGSLTGGFLLARFAAYPFKDRLVIGGALGFSAALIVFAFTRFMPAALVLLFVAGLLMTIFQSTVMTLMQQLTSDEMRGRVMSLFAISVIGMWPLGAGPLSWAADQFGVAAATTAGSAIAAAYMLVLVFRAGHLLRQFRTS
ncbi:MAG TPA: MFS transporter [Symbiobacteriaceae bacterium]|nr:MFS transporter [Symbiobacteriaceae bacterium]